MQNPADICENLEVTYREIETTRMEGVPILNDALEVRALGFEVFGEYHLGVLLTPWFMNLMMLPLDSEVYAENAPDVGDKLTLAFPAGQVEYIVGFEDALGHYLACSLFSPVFEFEDQEAALQTAKSALDEILNIEAETADEDPGFTNLWEGRLPEPEEEPEEPRGPVKDVNRRDFLRGGRARDDESAVVEETL